MNEEQLQRRLCQPPSFDCRKINLLQRFVSLGRGRSLYVLNSLRSPCPLWFRFRLFF
jgi:hypothetical protein